MQYASLLTDFVRRDVLIITPVALVTNLRVIMRFTRNDALHLWLPKKLTLR